MNEWIPQTELGKKVKEGAVTSMSDVLRSSNKIMEIGIIDALMPELNEKDYQEVLNVNMVQRMTDSGRRVKFSVVAVVGNKNGFVGLGEAKAGEVGPAIRKALDNAKINLIEVRRGCGSWECACGRHHSVPFRVTGKSSSVRVILKPAPRGLGLAIGDIGKKILTLAGVRDVWSFTEGQTQTTVNFAKAVFNALKQTTTTSVQEGAARQIGVVTGKVE
ncbi:MAG: 30S ribosomal protein S5 [Theionarchaea archaeon]|nr:30S ribosomal protein S5 [Theionarchaea archaeon]MBU7001766.1 30S ribosomal protein S5 [Theionarchaea archaeon]MBU7022285.1 30S ribosomal protein S5 [Theionarchaea archaeon]MBU7035519.1 30S ribosomal protein S5 [Theionarchaea archaeon]MBU7041134.1 30S ribosomal protein S5 [Theionarchaea archaeon]